MGLASLEGGLWFFLNLKKCHNLCNGFFESGPLILHRFPTSTFAHPLVLSTRDVVWFQTQKIINVRKCGTEVKHEEMTHPSNSKASRLDPVRSAQFRVYNLRLLKPRLNLSADVATLVASMRLEIATADSQAWSEVSNHWSTCKAAVSQNVY